MRLTPFVPLSSLVSLLLMVPITVNCRPVTEDSGVLSGSDFLSVFINASLRQAFYTSSEPTRHTRSTVTESYALSTRDGQENDATYQHNTEYPTVADQYLKTTPLRQYELNSPKISSAATSQTPSASDEHKVPIVDLHSAESRRENHETYTHHVDVVHKHNQYGHVPFPVGQARSVSYSTVIRAVPVKRNKTISGNVHISEKNDGSHWQSQSEPEKNYELEESVSVLSNGRAHGVQGSSSSRRGLEDNQKVGYVVEGRNFRKYRVEERTSDGYIVGEYGVVSHDDGSMRGVRYTADSTANPRLIYDALMKFLAL